MRLRSRAPEFTPVFLENGLRLPCTVGREEQVAESVLDRMKVRQKILPEILHLLNDLRRIHST